MQTSNYAKILETLDNTALTMLEGIDYLYRLDAREPFLGDIDESNRASYTHDNTTELFVCQFCSVTFDSYETCRAHETRCIDPTSTDTDPDNETES